MKVLANEGKAILLNNQALNADSVTDKQLTEHIADTTIHVTAEEKATWNGKQNALDAATEVPAMDGTAVVGTSVKYAREDHVHPSDTSKLSLTGGTMTGFLTLSGAPTSDLMAATRKYVDDSIQSAIQATWEASY